MASRPRRTGLLLGAGVAAVLVAGVYLGRASRSSEVPAAAPLATPATTAAPARAPAAAAPRRAPVPAPALAAGHAAVAPGLAADLADASPRVRAAALREAAKDPATDPAILLAATRDADPAVATLATDLLGARYAEGGVPVAQMLERARDRGANVRVRAASLNALGVVAQPEAAALLVDLLAHGDPLERRSAAILLVHQDPEVAIPALIDALADTDEVVRDNALGSLRTRSRGRDFGRDAAAWRAWWQARPR